MNIRLNFKDRQEIEKSSLASMRATTSASMPKLRRWTGSLNQTP